MQRERRQVKPLIVFTETGDPLAIVPVPLLEQSDWGVSEVVHIIIEAFDALKHDSKQMRQTVIDKLLHLVTPDAIPNKVVKVILTSTRPDAGFEDMFGMDNKLQYETRKDNILIRLSPVMARTCKHRSIMPKERRTRYPSDADNHFREPSAESRLTADDFDPASDEILPEQPIKRHSACDSELDEDFDIFDDSPRLDGARPSEHLTNTSLSIQQDISFTKSASTSQSSFDIYM
ncbi:hypothetical protein NPX13_g8563 [Xylaria arbuscula]|uniref:Uncharacterized protein n=1 Tax=Xylaria arbuscula TaxID=114810 RepID=A0A9W8N863_9PEZI|nr:hypothetical protein NPX13_g8563 [Xylaria arbuscula]